MRPDFYKNKAATKITALVYVIFFFFLLSKLNFSSILVQAWSVAHKKKGKKYNKIYEEKS